MMGHNITVILLDNRSFGRINRLQKATGCAAFNNQLDDCLTAVEGAPKLDFAAHARAMGAIAEEMSGVVDLEAALQRARQADRST